MNISVIFRKYHIIKKRNGKSGGISCLGILQGF